MIVRLCSRSPRGNTIDGFGSCFARRASRSRGEIEALRTQLAGRQDALSLQLRCALDRLHNGCSFLFSFVFSQSLLKQASLGTVERHVTDAYFLSTASRDVKEATTVTERAAADAAEAHLAQEAAEARAVAAEAAAEAAKAEAREVCCTSHPRTGHLCAGAVLAGRATWRTNCQS